MMDQEKVLAQYRESVNALFPGFPETAWQYLQAGIDVTHCTAKTNYIEAGNRQQSIGFVAEGLVRGYYVDAKGNEVTMRFVAEGDYATHYSALLTDLPSHYTFQCLEPTTFANLSYAHIIAGYDQFPALERISRIIAEQVLINQRHRLEGFQFLNAEQRYLRFLKEHPGLFNRISLTHLASFLGIERPSLSRIRKKLADN